MDLWEKATLMMVCTTTVIKYGGGWVPGLEIMMREQFMEDLRAACLSLPLRCLPDSLRPAPCARAPGRVAASPAFNPFPALFSTVPRRHRQLPRPPSQGFVSVSLL